MSVRQQGATEETARFVSMRQQEGATEETAKFVSMRQQEGATEETANCVSMRQQEGATEETAKFVSVRQQEGATEETANCVSMRQQEGATEETAKFVRVRQQEDGGEVAAEEVATASFTGLQRQVEEPSERVMEDTARTSQAHLEPFHHQVAGQSLVFRYDAHTICKSLIPRELHIYRTLPDLLKPHVPEFRGVVNITLEGPRSDSEEREGDEGARHPLTTQRLLDKVAKSHAQDNAYHFILLENLVADYQRPCVLDLKLGTRQHGDDAPPDKIQYQVDKCRNTTSAPLGVRLCGMKVYQNETEDYVQVDKAEGRRMREDDFREAMFQFLFNGHHVRRELIPELLRHLQSLKTAIAQLPTYRFYSSSLLIVYDGAEKTNDSGPVASLRKSGDTRTNGGRCDCDSESSSPCCGNSRSDADENALSPKRTIAVSEGAQNCSTQGDASRVRIPSHRTNCQRLSLNDRTNQSSSGLPTHSHTFPVPEQAQEHLVRTLDGTAHPVNRDAFASVAPARNLQNNSSQRPDRNPQNSPTELRDGDIQSCSSRRSGRSSRNACTDLHDGDVQNGSTQRFDRNHQNAPTQSCDGEFQDRSSGRPDSSRQNASSELRDGDAQDCSDQVPGWDDSAFPSDTSTRLPSSCRCSQSKVDVRLVDFAHTTYAGFEQDKVIHEGVDRGCLLGLQTLIDTFTQIYNEGRK